LPTINCIYVYIYVCVYIYNMQHFADSLPREIGSCIYIHIHTYSYINTRNIQHFADSLPREIGSCIDLAVYSKNRYVCMYVCMYACMYAAVFDTFRWMHHMKASVCLLDIHTYAFMQFCMYVFMHAYVCIHACIYANCMPAVGYLKHFHTFKCIYIRIFMYTRVLCAYHCVTMWPTQSYTCIHAYSYSNHMPALSYSNHTQT
jgi:hypothetical protein